MRLRQFVNAGFYPDRVVHPTSYQYLLRARHGCYHTTRLFALMRMDIDLLRLWLCSHTPGWALYYKVNIQTVSFTLATNCQLNFIHYASSPRFSVTPPSYVESSPACGRFNGYRNSPIEGKEPHSLRCFVPRIGTISTLYFFSRYCISYLHSRF